jgi:transposase
VLHDIPAFGSPVRLTWRKRTFRCVEPACPVGVFSEVHELGRPRAKLTERAAWWAIGCIRDDTSLAAVARRLGVAWRTLWEAVVPILTDLAGDPARFEQVSILGVDEHVWHHTPRPGKGPKELTGMVDLSRDAHGHSRARLLDLVPGRSGPAYAGWLHERGTSFTDGVRVATLDPFRGYANAIDDQLEDAAAVLDAFHVTRLGLKAMEETRRRVQQNQLGHRGHRDDPLYQIRNTLRAGVEKLSTRQLVRIEAGLQAGDPDFEVTVAWHCYQQLRSVYAASDLRHGQRTALQVLESFHTCPIPEIARLGRTLRAWRAQFLGYFTTGRASNGGTEAINGIIELHRRIARGFRNPHNYRLRMILAAGKLTHPNLR